MPPSISVQGNVSDMIEEVKDAFKVRLKEKDWLDNTTKKRCVEKVDAISEMVAYPERIDNNTYLDDLYAEVREGRVEEGREGGREGKGGEGGVLMYEYNSRNGH